MPVCNPILYILFFAKAAPCVQNGKEYWFTTKEKFEKGIEEGKFLEYAYVHSNIYGTSLKVCTLFRTGHFGLQSLVTFVRCEVCLSCMLAHLRVPDSQVTPAANHI